MSELLERDRLSVIALRTGGWRPVGEGAGNVLRRMELLYDAAASMEPSPARSAVIEVAEGLAADHFGAAARWLEKARNYLLAEKKEVTVEALDITLRHLFLPQAVEALLETPLTDAKRKVMDLNHIERAVRALLFHSESEKKATALALRAEVRLPLT